MTITCEEIQEIIDSENLNSSLSDDLASIVENILQQQLKALVNAVFIDSTIKLISAFLESCHQHPPLATMSMFNKEDAALKKAITDFNGST